jgi:hypothetical protein
MTEFLQYLPKFQALIATFLHDNTESADIEFFHDRKDCFIMGKNFPRTKLFGLNVLKICSASQLAISRRPLAFVRVRGQELRGFFAASSSKAICGGFGTADSVYEVFIGEIIHVLTQEEEKCGWVGIARAVVKR